MISATAAAQTDPDELARRHFESGAAYFEQAEYDSALREFQKAYDLSKRPQILRNVSIVEERLGHLEQAVAALDEYLAQAPDDPDIETVRIRRDNLRKRLERERATTPPPPTKTREQKPAQEPEQASTPDPAPVPDETEVDQEPTEEPWQAPPLEEGQSLLPAYLLFGLGGVAGAASIVTGIMAKTEYDNLTSSCDGPCTDAETRQGETLALASTVLTGVAVAAVGSGLLLWLTADESAEAPSARKSLRVDVALSPSGGLGTARWTF